MPFRGKHILRLLLLHAILLQTVQASDVEFEFRTVDTLVRSNAPIAGEITLSWNSSELLEGHLEIDLVDRKNESDDAGWHRATWRSHDIAMSFGKRRSSVLLPTLRLYNDRGILTLRPRFVTAEHVYPLPPVEVRVPLVHRRRSLMGYIVATDATRESEKSFEMLQALRLQQYEPDDQRKWGVATVYQEFNVRYAAGTAAGWSGCDLVVCEDDLFAELRAKQRDALFEWVRAGGALLLRVPPSMERGHADFLNDLLTLAGTTDASFIVDDTGSVTQMPDGLAEDFLLLEAGLGRVALTAGDPVELLKNRIDDFPSERRRRVTGFLWSLRNNTQARINRSGLWKPFPRNLQTWDRSYFYQPYPIKRDGLERMLRPERVRTIPAGRVAVILVLFVLAIAPFDYFVLGLLKRRVLTWILFPLTCIGFTLFTIAEARHYSGAGDYRTAVHFIDMVDDTTVVRVSRIEQLFTATERTATTSLKHTLASPFTPRQPDMRRTAQTWTANQGTVLQMDEDRDEAMDEQIEPEQWEGQIPVTWNISQAMRKWSPTRTRYTQFGADPRLPEFQWPKFDPNQLPTLTGRLELADAIHAIWPHAEIAVLTRTNRFEFHSGPSVPPQLAALHDFAVKVSSAPTKGMFERMWQIAPNGSELLEDLAMFDAEDPTHWLVVVSVKQGDDCFVWRRRFKTSKQPTAEADQ